MNGIWSKVKRYRFTIVDALVLVAVAGLFLSYFEPRYLLSKTITTGGDTPSHYYSAQYLKDVLLPKGKIIGWTQGNYAGFPLFLFYFPLPFVIMVLMSLAIPMQIAFKLVTVLGTFLLPVCTYFSLRLMKYDFPIPIFGALFTLPFLFMEANSMWGGNIPSTLAGEFAFSLGFALSILFIGSLYSGISSGAHAIPNGVLVALIGFSHGYTVLFSGLASLFFLITTQNLRQRFLYLVKVHGLAFLLMGFWIVPLLLNLPYNTRYNYVWIINSILEVFPYILLPLVSIAILGRIIAPVSAFWRNPGLLKFSKESWVRQWNKRDLRIFYLWFCVIVSGFFYLVAFRINVVDIRFLPFLQLFLCIIAAIELGRAVRLLRAQWVFPVILAIAVFLWVDHQEKNVKNWIVWNYTGFEGKAMWPVFAKVNESLKGTLKDPRVVYEHSMAHNSLGTPRAFESLPLFTGRSTLEGIYMQSSISSPFVFYIQSEISKEISCPLPDYGCSKLDLTHGIRHLKMFNVRDFIVFSNEVKSEIKKHPEFVLKESIPPYELYELSTNENRYVTPLKYEPVLYRTDRWKTVSYRWFKNSQINDVHLVFDQSPGSENQNRFKTVLGGELPSELPRIPVEGDCQVGEVMAEEEILIRTDCIQKPLLVKVSYHPNWKVEGADRVYLVSPSFMLIYPEQEQVRLTFSRAGADYAGSLMTITGMLMLVLNLPLLRESRIRLTVHKGASTVAGKLRDSGLYLRLSGFWGGYRTKILMTGWATLAILLFAFWVVSNREDAGVLYAKGIKYLGENKPAEARTAFEKVIRNYPDTSSAMNSSYYYAITYFKEGNYPKVIHEFERLIKDYPESNWVPEAYYHIGLSYARLNNLEKARDAYQLIIDRYPTSNWAGHSRSRLLEMAQGGAVIGQSASALYNQAMEYFDAQRYSQAREFFQKVQVASPNTKLAEHAHYFQAITFFKEEKYRSVIEEFERFTQNYPQSEYVPEAYYHIGLSYQRLKDGSRAKRAFEKVIREFPDSRWAGFSKERLRESNVQKPELG